MYVVMLVVNNYKYNKKEALNVFWRMINSYKSFL